MLEQQIGKCDTDVGCLVGLNSFYYIFGGRLNAETMENKTYTPMNSRSMYIWKKSTDAKNIHFKKNRLLWAQRGKRAVEAAAKDTVEKNEWNGKKFQQKGVTTNLGCFILSDGLSQGTSTSQQKSISIRHIPSYSSYWEVMNKLAYDRTILKYTAHTVCYNLNIIKKQKANDFVMITKNQTI